MSALAQVALALGALLALLGMMVMVRRLAGSARLGAELQRKLVHIGTGLFALCLPWLFPARWPVYLLLAMTLLVMLVLRLPRFSAGLGGALHSVERTSYGDFLLAIAVGLCFLLAGDNRLYYVLPIAVLTLADVAAALAGTTYGTRHFAVEEGQKSIEGSAAFFVTTLFIAIIGFVLMSDLPMPNVLALCVMVAAFGTLVEAQSWRGFDNLFLPLGLLVFLTVHGNRPLADLVALGAIFFLAIVSFRRLGPKLGLSHHAARVYVIAMFLVLAVTAVQNAILPALVLVAHAWARTVHPCHSRFPDLDIVAALGLVSFGWLALGNATGWNAVSFYGLSAMAMAMGLSAVALQSRLVAVLGIAAGLLALRICVVAMNPAAKNWAEPLTLVAVLSLVLTAAPAFMMPGLFLKDRIFKLTLLALIVPLAYYTFAVTGLTGETPPPRTGVFYE